MPPEDDIDAGIQLLALADLLTPMAVRVAATLRIADYIANGVVTAAQLADATDTNADALDRVLRHLVTHGVFGRETDGRYSLTPMSAYLRADHAWRLRSLFDIDRSLGRAELSFVQLLHSVRTGEAAFPVQYGRPFWDDLASDPDRNAEYDVAMGGDVALWAAAILSAYDWGALGHLVDVGGGNGTLLIALLNAHPQLRGTVFDQPATAAGAARAIAAAGLSERADTVGGDFFQAVPAGADGYVLTAIIHDWDDASSLAILRRCVEAAGRAGKIFVIEKIGRDGVSPNTAMDLRMLTHLGGQERALTDLVALTEEAGCELVEVHTVGAIAVLELRPRV